jgi:hypothetical protein
MSLFHDSLKDLKYTTYANIDLTTNLVNDRSITYWYVGRAKYTVREVKASKMVNDYKIEVHAGLGSLNTLSFNNLMGVRIIDSTDNVVPFTIINELFNTVDEFIAVVKDLAENVKTQYNEQQYKVIAVSEDSGLFVHQGMICIPALDMRSGELVDLSTSSIDIKTIEIKSIDI